MANTSHHWTWISSLGFRAGARGFALASMFVLTIVGTQQAEAQSFNVIHDFTGGADGANPLTGLTMDKNGSFYGTTYAGGVGFGTVYKLVPSGSSGWVVTPLYGFTGGKDGAGPYGRVTFGPNGLLYGTTRSGGGYTGCNRYDYNGCGTVFSLAPLCKDSRCLPTEAVLYAFSGGSDGAHPAGGALSFDQAGISMPLRIRVVHMAAELSSSLHTRAIAGMRAFSIP